MSDLTVNILGFAAVNRDLKVELRDPTTNAVVREVSPYLDGTVRIPKINAGAYDLTVKHPNLALPVLRRPIRVLPTGDTKVSVLIDPSQFRNTPIEDIPESNLAPVRDMLQSVGETILPLANKQPGEAIRAEDWNTLVSGLRDVAQAVAELTRLVSPTGHDHLEFNRKFDEVTQNFSTLLNTLSAAMTELQRQIQTERMREQIIDVLDVAEVPIERRKEFLAPLDKLQKSVTESPIAFGRKARTAGVEIEQLLENLKGEKQPDFATSKSVESLGETANLLKRQPTTSYTAELEHLRRVDRTGANAGLIGVFKNREK
jgi:hypothetical protein